MTLGLSKDIWCHVWPYPFLCLHITRSDVRPQVNFKWAVRLVIAGDHLKIFLRGLCGYVWVNAFTLSPELVCKAKKSEVNLVTHK